MVDTLSVFLLVPLAFFFIPFCCPVFFGDHIIFNFVPIYSLFLPTPCIPIHILRRLHVPLLHHYITFFLLPLYSHVSYPPLFVRRSSSLLYYYPFLSSSRLSFPYHATTQNFSFSFYPDKTSFFFLSYNSPLTLLSSFIYRPFSFRNILSHLSAATPVGDSFSLFLSSLFLSLSRGQNTVDPRAVNIPPVVYDPHPVRGSPRTGLNSYKTRGEFSYISSPLSDNVSLRGRGRRNGANKRTNSIARRPRLVQRAGCSN